jgi:hypothetical protein
MFTLYPPARALLIFLRGALRRLTCPHLAWMPDDLTANSQCARCGAWR